MSHHIVTAYSDELEGLAADILRLGGLVEDMIPKACDAAVGADTHTAREVIEADRDVDQLEAEIERKIVEILARRQPMARDLRGVLAALKISNELERIGDLAKNIAKRAGALSEIRSHGVLKGTSRMGRAVASQLALVLDAYRNQDPAMARQVWEGDEEIDQLYNSYFREVQTYMLEDPRMIGLGAHMMFMAKNLERVGDHATNIAELTYFFVTGENMALEERPKADRLQPETPEANNES